MQPITDLVGLLVTAGRMAEAEAVRLRHEAAATGRVQIRVVREAGLVSDADILRALHQQLSLQILDLRDETVVELDALRGLTQDVAETHLVLPVRLDNVGGERRMHLAMADPLCSHSVQTVERISGYHVIPLLAEAGPLTRAIGRAYGRVTTKLIPRPEDRAADPWPKGFADGVHEPETQPAHRLEDEASPVQMVHALVNLLVDKGVLDPEDFVTELKRLLRAELEE